MPSPYRRLLPLAAALVLGSPGASPAQGVGVSAVALSAHHDLLGDPLAGAAVHVLLRRPAGPVGVRLGVERLRGEAERVGAPCGGLVEPGTCGPERVRDAGRLTLASAGVVGSVRGGRHAAVALTADLTAGSVRARTRGLASGGTISASKAVWGALFGVEGSWTPVSRVPLALELGAAVGGLLPFSSSDLVDGYAPFDDAFGVRRVRLGVAWRRGA